MTARTNNRELETAEARRRIENRLFMDQAIAMQQKFNPYYDMRNFFRQPADNRPLDERFADFKRRLDDAVRRNERRKQG